MTFQATIQPSGYRLGIEEHETILEAVLRHGYTMPHSCREGVCGVCKGKIVEGQVDRGNYLGATLTNVDKSAGMALFCCARPESDLVIECHAVGVRNDTPVRILPCRLKKMNRLADDIMALHLELPAGERLRFFAGQYVSILPRDQKPRNFSLANAPHSSELLELHISRAEGDSFTQHVFNEMKERDILRIKGPLGKLRMREDSDKPVIFVAGEAVFAPIKAMIEHALHIGLQRPLHLYWGVRKPADLYMLDMIGQWESFGLRFTPVIAAALPEDGWYGRTGLVHQAVLDDFDDLSEHEIYACGAPAMLEAARHDFTARRGLPAESFFSDTFALLPEYTSPFQEYSGSF